MTMNAYLSAIYRDVTCAAVALVITLIVGASFVESTAVAPGAQTSVSAPASQHQQA
jgi:hypothetical protein